MGVEEQYHQKQPGETYQITEDFATNRAESAESVDSQTVVAYDLNDDDAVVTATYIGTVMEDAGVVTVPLLAAGSDGDRILIRIRVTMDSGNIYEQDIILSVKD